ncbi:MAG: hypothetical protein HY674_13550, partial [Chloroflexi bacterium]|nr:hypothetical protein [Chloroflexota bacterium]
HLHDVVLELTAKADGTVLIQADRASDLPALIELAKANWQTQAPGAQWDGHRITVPLGPNIIELSPAR